MRKSRKVLVLVAALGLFLSLSGITYAYLRVRKGQETSNDLSTLRCLGVDFEDKTSNISMNNAYAVSDDEGMKTPAYTFKITNKCNTIIYAKVNLETLEVEKMLGLNHVKVWFNHENLDSPKLATLNNESVFGRETVTLDAAIQSNNLTEINLGAYESAEFNLRLWIDEETTAEEGMDKNYSAKVTVSVSPNPNTSVAKGDLTMYAYIDGVISSTFPSTNNYNTSITCNSFSNDTSDIVGTARWNGTKWVVNLASMDSGETVCNVYFTKKSESEIEAPNGWYTSEDGTLLAAIRKNNPVGSPATNPGSLVSTSTEAVLASTADDYGTSFYFRGNVQSNFVVFANMCWRIVRVTGNGAIKLILYNRNDNNVENPCSEAANGTNAFIKYDGTNMTVAYGNQWADCSNVFMCGSDSSIYGNDQDNTVLTSLKTWYDLKLRNYNNLLADTIWCNDKTKTRSNTPSLICPNVNVSGIDANASKLTAIDTLNGNGKLLGANGSGDKEYKIGLITTDEFIFAGGRIYTWSTSVTETNTTLYLYANATSGWWTMSPSTNNSSNGSRYVYTFNVEDGRLAGTITNTSLYLRPMISLISTIQISSGTGTYLEPYRIIVN